MPLFDAVPAFAAALPAAGRLAAFDVGAKTVGVAVSDPDRMIASPLFTQRRGKWAADEAAIRTALADRAPVGFVVGLPLHMTGETSPRAQAARQFAKNWIAGGDAPVLLWDERLSTAAVDRMMLSADVTRKKRAAAKDELAAAWILQGVLDGFAQPFAR